MRFRLRARTNARDRRASKLGVLGASGIGVRPDGERGAKQRSDDDALDVAPTCHS
jgi:hypothetical protein